MKIEAGKYYRVRNGEVVGPMKPLPSWAARPWTDNGLMTWSEDGRIASFDHVYDIISESVKPDAAPPAEDFKGAAGALKSQLHLIPTEAMTEMAAALMNGAGRYGAWNWRGTRIKSSTYIAAIMRHTLAYRDGEDVAPDSQVTHLGHIMANCAILLDAAKHNALEDDRPKP